MAKTTDTMEKPKFCNYCGMKLIVREGRHDYDIYTGKKKMRLECPNANDSTSEGILHFSVRLPIF